MPGQFQMKRAPLLFLRYAGGTSAAGLFVLWRVSAKTESEEKDTSDFALAFCGRDGTLHDISVANPWPLALTERKSIGAELGAPPLTSAEVPHDFVLIAHPSPQQAKLWHRHMVQGHPPNGPGGAPLDWPLLRGIVPKLEGGNLVVDLPETSDAYLPAGHRHFDGWVLYRRMPYAGLPEVRTQVQKLAFLLGKLRFPTNVQGSRTRPYPTSESDHSGEFDVAIQASLHRFEEAMRNSVGFQLSTEGRARRGTGTSEKETWAYLLGEPTIDVPVARVADDSPVAQLEPDVVEESMGQVLLDWDAAGVRMHGQILVTRIDKERTLHAFPEVLLGVRALELTAKALGMPYNLMLSNTWRNLEAMGKGQAQRSFHKLGRAVDLEYGFFREPSGSMPLAFEADRPAADELRWQLYAHSTLDPFNEEVDVEKALAEARKSLRGELEEHLGSKLPMVVVSYLARVEQIHTEVVSLGRSGKLGDVFFRKTVSRFQSQAGEVTGGDRMPAVGAAEDATGNGVAGSIKSWLNLSRLAFRLGLKGISARRGELGPVSNDLFREDSYTKIRPGDHKERIAKALALDELASGIEALQRLGGTSVHVETGSGKFIGVPISSIHLDAIRSWMRRTSDPPQMLPSPPSQITFADHGVDMTIEFVGASGLGEVREELDRYLRSRGSIPVKAVHVGGGLRFSDKAPLTSGTRTSIRGVADALQESFVIPGQADRRVVLRPIYAPELPDADPATHTYQIVKTHDPRSLEWWHLEVLSDGLDWHGSAERMGLSAKVLEAPRVPGKDDLPPRMPWVGGAGFVRPKFSPAPETEPNNQPGRG